MYLTIVGFTPSERPRSRGSRTPVHALFSMGFGPDLLAQLDLSLLDSTRAEPYRVGRVCFRAHDQVRLLLDHPSGRPEERAARLAASVPSLEDVHDPSALSSHPVVVGDWVLFRPTLDPPLVTARFGRRSLLRRRDPGGAVQPVAANLDLAMICMALGRDVNPRRLERWLAVTTDAAVEPLVLLTKADRDVDPASIAEASDQLGEVARGVPILPVSATDDLGREAVLERLSPGRTTALLGASGVGKSTLINWLLGAPVQDTGAVRLDDQRGRHTTTARELLALPVAGGFAWILDNPGVRQVTPVDADSVDATFPEVVAVLERCRFRDCGHEGDHGCAVPEALARGELTEARWRSFQKIQRELQWAAGRDDPEAMAARKAHWKKIHVMQKARNEHHGKGRR